MRRPNKTQWFEICGIISYLINKDFVQIINYQAVSGFYCTKSFAILVRTLKFFADLIKYHLNYVYQRDH